MRSLALTGNIASGKSSVATLLAAHGATIIDADQLARAAVAPGTTGLASIAAHFGPDVLLADGALDRAALRHRVFHDAAALDALNAIVHPQVARLRERALRDAHERGARVVISDIPLLFEVGLDHEFDGIILVDASVSTREARLVRDRRLAPEEARAMIDAQWPPERKRAGARWIIENDGSREALAARVGILWPEIEAFAALPELRSAADTSP